MKNFVKRTILLVIIVILLFAFVIFGKMAYTDVKSSAAKDYLMERYGFTKKEISASKVVEYVYEDISNCETLWFKKCTNDKNLHYIHTFKLQDGTVINVTEDVNHNFTDDYKGTVVKYNRKDEINAESNKQKEEQNETNEKEKN